MRTRCERALFLPLCGLLLAVAGCQRPQPPDTDKPPQPQALSRATQQPLQQAKGVQQAVDAADQRTREQEAEAEGSAH